MTDAHSCSFFCQRQECVTAQRDSLREQMQALYSDAMRYRYLTAEAREEEFFSDEPLCGAFVCIEDGDGGLLFLVGEDADETVDELMRSTLD